MLNQHYKYLHYIRPFRSAVRASMFNSEQIIEAEIHNTVSLGVELFNEVQVISSSIGNIDLGVSVELLNDYQYIEVVVEHRELNLSVSINNEGQYIESNVIHAALNISSEISNLQQTVNAELKVVASIQLSMSNYPQLVESEVIDPNTIGHPRWDDYFDSSAHGVDTFGFNALPSGYRDTSGAYGGIGSISILISTSKDLYNIPKALMLTSFSSSALEASHMYNEGFSIRMVRNYQVGDGTKTDGRIINNVFSDYDGNLYNGVIIGNQIWSTSNLKTTKYANGNNIPTGYNDSAWSSLSSGAYSIYPHTMVTGINSDQDMITKYGILYNWYTVEDSRGLLTSSGRIPSYADYEELLTYLSDNYSSIGTGSHLKSNRTAQ